MSQKKKVAYSQLPYIFRVIDDQNKMNVQEVIHVHHCIHDHSGSVTIRDIPYNIQTNQDGLRYVIVLGHKFMVC